MPIETSPVTRRIREATLYALAKPVLGKLLDTDSMPSRTEVVGGVARDILALPFSLVALRTVRGIRF